MSNHNAKNDVAVLGIDLAKTSFQLHGVDSLGVTVLKKKLTRKNLCEYIAQLPVCTIGIESCGGAHHWRRVFSKFGHAVHMIAPQFVKPFVKSNKNDAADAEAIGQEFNSKLLSTSCVDKVQVMAKKVIPIYQ